MGICVFGHNAVRFVDYSDRATMFCAPASAKGRLRTR
jgi:hypothetical protein